MIFVVKGFALIMVGVVGLVSAVNRSRTRAALRAKIAAAPGEFEDNAVVTFIGTVKSIGEPLVAPLSGKPCVAYRAVARTYVFRAGGAALLARSVIGSSRTLGQEVVDVELTTFVLATKSGDVIVEGETCELLLPMLPLIPRKLELEQSFLDRAGLDTYARDAGFNECRVEVGAKIRVHGVSRSELATAGETGFREAPTQIRISGDGAHLLTIDRA
ncbi:MAG TPA: hypothetical protein VH143_33730 [Kofleriaceae bacterium]|nr:hypothetical protein [Kofleriaceae bacterium]